MKRILRVLEYSSDSIETIQSILEQNYGCKNESTEILYKNPINGVMGGGAVVATCDPTTIKFIDGKYRLMRYLEYRSEDGKNKTALERILFAFEHSVVPIKGEKLIEENGFKVLIRSGIIGNGFGEDFDEEKGDDI